MDTALQDTHVPPGVTLVSGSGEALITCRVGVAASGVSVLFCYF